MLKRLAARIDTLGWRARTADVRSGWPSCSRPDLRFFSTSKVQYRYRERGQGPVIVFSTDPPVTLELYDDLLETFSKAFRVIVVEMPAMGFSVASSRYGFGFKESNDDLQEFLKAVAGRQAILAFSCVAGLGAVDIASRYPELVSRLVLIQTTDWDGFLAWKNSRDAKRILRKPIIGQIAMRRMAATRAPMWLDLVLGNREKLMPFCACASDSLNHGAGWALASAFQNYIDGPNPLMKPIQPVQVIWGTKDRSHVAGAAERARNFAEDVNLTLLEDLGHFPELEDPHRFLDLIMRDGLPAQ